MLMSLGLIGTICILSFRRFGSETGVWTEYVVNFDIVFASAYVFWMLLELKVARKEIDQGKQTSDFGTCELYAMGQGLTFLSALWFDSVWTTPGVVHFLGIFAFVVGVWYRLWAIRTLGRYYSHIVRRVSEHRIIDSGPYRFTRHPAYAGMIFANLGIVIYFFNWVTLGIFLGLLMPAIFLRILVEEKTLFTIKGYADFSKNRKRVFPPLW